MNRSLIWDHHLSFRDLGITGSQYPNPNATVYRSMAELRVEGFASLPKHCLTFCYVFFAEEILVNTIRDHLNKKYSKCIPLPIVMAIPFYLGPYFAIDTHVGSLILIWEMVNKANANANAFGPAVTSSLICGDGIWTLPSSILALTGVKPPICMKFLSRSDNTKDDGFLGNCR